MFTGIVMGVGRVLTVTPLVDGVHIAVDSRALELEDVRLGDSIAHSGVCLTVVARQGTVLEYDVSGETLACSVGLNEPGRELNLEKALRLGDALGGHLVTGHVDGIGFVERFAPVGGSTLLEIHAPAAIAPFLARKGSVAVDGVSLTVNAVRDEPDGSCIFSINLIPHTLAVTTLKNLSPGARVNLEVDPLARYCARVLEYAARNPTP
jgi:riboflavin synthase